MEKWRDRREGALGERVWIWSCSSNDSQHTEHGTSSDTDEEWDSKQSYARWVARYAESTDYAWWGWVGEGREGRFLEEGERVERSAGREGASCSSLFSLERSSANLFFVASSRNQHCYSRRSRFEIFGRSSRRTASRLEPCPSFGLPLFLFASSTIRSFSLS